MTKESKKILIVDDVKEIISGISSILEAEGFITLKAENGKQALGLIDDTIDLVISDILMPEMDGIELCQIINEKYPGLEVILISGGGRQSGINESYNYLETAKKLTGVNSILNKPFNPEELVTLINLKLNLN